MLHKDERLLAPTAFQCYVPRIFLGREVREEGRKGGREGVGLMYNLFGFLLFRIPFSLN